MLSLEGPTQVGESLGCSRKDVLRRPQRLSTFGTKRARADQHGVGESAQQAHHEAIRLIAPADDAARRRGAAFERHDPIDRADEVGIHASVRDRQPTVIELSQLERKCAGVKIGRLEQTIERLQERCPPAFDRVMFKNSSRSSGFDS